MKRFLRGLTAVLLILVLLVGPAAALTVEQAIELLGENFYYPIPPRAAEAEDVESLFALLGDPYTYYMDEEEYQEFLDSVENTVELVGIGISIQFTAEGILVLEPLAGGSAREAGMLAGDLIVAVDGVSCVPADENHRTLIMGDEGSEVTLTVLRGGETLEFVLVRKPVVIPNTQFEVWGEHIGYIDCSSFGTDTGKLIEDGVAANNELVDHWLVDLRSNTGGYSQSAVDALGVFCGAGYHMYMQDNAGGLYANPCFGDRLTDHPVVVMVDEYTASASEAFTAGVRDYGLGVSVGSRTYGKGTAQGVLNENNYPDYFSGDAMKVTMYRFCSPGGVTNDKVGVIPTLMVSSEMTEPVALALCGSTRSDVENQLMIELVNSLFAVDLEVVEPEVLSALFEALPPQTRLWIYQGDVALDYTVTAAAEKLGVTYQSRWFSDVEDSSFKKAINTLATYGLVQGDENGNFNPKDTLTRGDVCVMLAGALSVDGREGQYFSDVAADDPRAPYVNALTEMGLIQGMGDGTFLPDKAMTQQEYYALLGRVICTLNLSWDYSVEEVLAQQGGKVREMGFLGWAEEGAALMSKAKGLCFSSGEADPTAAILREEAAATLCAVLQAAGVIY